MDRITIKAKTYSEFETVTLILSLMGIFASAILSNYVTTASKYIFFVSLATLIVFIIKKITKSYEQLPLIENSEESIRVFKYKNRPFLGLALSRMVDIKWDSISKFSAASFSGSHSLSSIWYCFEDNKRNIVENFIATEHINEINTLIDLVKKKLNADKINLEGMK